MSRRALRSAVLVLALEVLVGVLVVALARGDASPQPTRTRVVTRPTASPIPGYEPLAVEVSGPVLRPVRGARAVPLVARIVSQNPAVVRAALFLFPPGVPPNPLGHGNECRKGTSELRLRVRDAAGTLGEDLESTPALIRCLFTWKAPRGVHQACAHIPNEPGSAWNDYMVCVPFEVQ